MKPTPLLNNQEEKPGENKKKNRKIFHIHCSLDVKVASGSFQKLAEIEVAYPPPPPKKIIIIIWVPAYILDILPGGWEWVNTGYYC